MEFVFGDDVIRFVNALLDLQAEEKERNKERKKERKKEKKRKEKKK